MKELLLRYGYELTGKCNCDGHATEKYRRDEYLLRLRTKQNTFKIKHAGRALTNWASCFTLETTLNNIHLATISA